MSGVSAFSSDDDVTKKHVDLVASKPAVDVDNVHAAYELDRCLKWIEEGGFSKVALQFPDELLVDSVLVQVTLQNGVGPGTMVVILGDTSYGSCCVDEVAAEHYQADSIIHFGSACLSPTDRLPVLYVFCHQPVDAEHAAEQVQGLLTSAAPTLILIADTMFQHALESVAEQLKARGVCVATSFLQLPSSSDASGVQTDENGTLINSEGLCVYCKGCRHFALPKGNRLDDCMVCFIGKEGRVLTNLMMTLNKCQFVSYCPESRTARRETLNVNKALMKRYYMIERAKEARIVGIVAGTLGMSRTKDIISHLKMLVKGAGKKSYTFVVGKLNVAKLANFMEVDVFVLVACPQNTIIDSKDFLKPVVTPFEMDLACNQAREWTGDYITDFLEILPGAAEHVPVESAAEDMVDVSLISNKLVGLSHRSAIDGQTESSALQLRSDSMALTCVQADTAGEFLAARSWQGLDRQLGQTPVEKAKMGRSGIAMGYKNEPQ